MAEQKTINVVNGVNTNILQDTVGKIKKEPELGKCSFHVNNKWINGNHNCNSIIGFYVAKQDIPHKQQFELHADEPPMLAGQDKAANPVEYLLSALASCLTTSMVAHAAVRGIHIEELESEIEGDIDMNGYLGLSEDVPKGYTNIRVKFKVKSDADMEKLKKLAAYSPVYNTITNGASVDIQLEPK